MAAFIVYGASVVALAYALLETWRYADRLRLPRVVIVCLTAALLVYLAGLIPATLGVLTGPVAGGLLVVLSALTAWLLRSAARPPPHNPSVPEESGPWHAVDVAFCVAAAVLMSPMLDFVREFKGTVTHPGVALPWDTASYHLPVLIEMVQRRSLWGLQGPFSSYALGYELIAGYPALFFRSHAGLVLANGYALVFLVATLVLISRLLVRAINGQGGRVNGVVTALVAVALWCVIYPGQPKMIGKNDVFLGALVLATLGLLVEAASAAAPARNQALLRFAALSMGLAVGTKVTALMYMPFFAVLVWATTPRERFQGRETSPRRPGRALARVAAFTATSAVVGGIWYVRNVIEIGRPIAPEHTWYFELSLFRNLSSPHLHHLGRSATFSLLAASTPLVMFSLIWLVRRRGNGVPGSLAPLVAFTAFLVTACLVYLMTPLVVFQETKWQLRLGMPFFSAAAVAAALALTWVGTWRLLRTYPAALALLVVAVASVAFPARWAQKVRPGLPQYEVVRDLPRTGVYTWVEKSFDRPVRIYSAGLRPCGVVGTRWQNAVFADSHSHLLFDDDVRPQHGFLLHDLAAAARAHSIVGKGRLFAVLESFRPDLVIIAVEADENWPTEKPLVGWMREQPFFHEVYDDAFATAFKVDDGWQSLAPQYPAPPNKTLRMGS